MRRGIFPLLFGSLLLLDPVPTELAAQATRAPLSVTGPQQTLGCDSVSGRYIAFPAPDEGVALLSSAPFPGANEVGTLDGERATIHLAGNAFELDATGPTGPLYGVVDRGIATAEAGCVGFDKDRFTWPSDLLTYLRWLYRDVVPVLGAEGWLQGRGLHLGERRVYLSVGGPGVQPLEVAAVEGGLAGLRLTGREGTWYLRPFVLHEGARAAVFVLRGVGPVYGADGLEPAGVVLVEEASPSDTGAGFTLQLAGIVAE